MCSIVTDIPAVLLWGVPIALGLFAAVCVILLFVKRRSLVGPQWGGSAGGALGRGQYVQHLTRVLRAIRAVNKIIVTERAKTSLLEKACRTLTKTRGYKMAWIGEAEEQDKRVRPIAQAGIEKGYLAEIEITWDTSPTGQGPTGRAIRTGEPAVMRDIESDPQYEPWREQALQRGYRSSAAVPLRFEGRVLGVLNVYSEFPAAFDIQELGLLQEVCDHIAYALGTLQLKEDLDEARSQAREDEPGFRAFEHAPLAILVTDARGVVTALNGRARQLLPGGGEGEQAAGHKQLRDLGLPPDAFPRKNLQRVFKEQTVVQTRCQHVLEDGRRTALACRGAAVRDDNGKLQATVWTLVEVPGTDGQP